MRELFEKFRSYSIVSIIVSALCGLALLIFRQPVFAISVWPLGALC